jgi:hypothetical protein
MKVLVSKRGALLVALVLSCSPLWAMYFQQPQEKDQKKEREKQQQQQQQQKPPEQQKQSEPAPLFGGALNLKSSRQTKDTATLGFNGLGPNGEVDKKVMAEAAAPADESKAQQLMAYKVDPAEVDAFAQEGHLKSGK